MLLHFASPNRFQIVSGYPASPEAYIRPIFIRIEDRITSPFLTSRPFP